MTWGEGGEGGGGRVRGNFSMDRKEREGRREVLRGPQDGSLDWLTNTSDISYFIETIFFIVGHLTFYLSPVVSIQHLACKPHILCINTDFVCMYKHINFTFIPCLSTVPPLLLNFRKS